MERALYHGIAGLLEFQADWPEDVKVPLRHQSVAQAMWEIRHRIVVSDLIQKMRLEGLEPLVLKGTALAYDLYPEPAMRSRGDTDLLVAEEDLASARTALRGLGFRQSPDMGLGDNLKLKEGWIFEFQGTNHLIDLHWSTTNTHVLRGIFPYAKCLMEKRHLMKLCAGAAAMSHLDALMFACLHRAKHITSPYYVSGVRYLGGDRLIWVKDIQLLAEALEDAEWKRLVLRARETGLGQVCVDGLIIAQNRLGANIPQGILQELKEMEVNTVATTYLLGSSGNSRAWKEAWAVQGVGKKLLYIRQKLFPSRAFMEWQYPDMKGGPLLRMQMRRIVSFFMRRGR